MQAESLTDAKKLHQLYKGDNCRAQYMGNRHEQLCTCSSVTADQSMGPMLFCRAAGL